MGTKDEKRQQGPQLSRTGDSSSWNQVRAGIRRARLEGDDDDDCASQWAGGVEVLAKRYELHVEVVELIEHVSVESLLRKRNRNAFFVDMNQSLCILRRTFVQLT